MAGFPKKALYLHSIARCPFWALIRTPTDVTLGVGTTSKSQSHKKVINLSKKEQGIKVRM